MPPLKNLRQETFCLEYMKTGDITASYRKAGYKPLNDNSCSAGASQLLRNIKIKSRLSELQERTANRVEVSAARVINELGRIAFSDVRKVIGQDGTIVDTKDWDDDMAGAVAGIETEKLFEGKGKDKVFIGYTQKLKLWDKNTALTNLAKHFKLLSDDAPAGDTNVHFHFHMPINSRDPQEHSNVPSNGHGPTLVGNGHGDD
jgi:phage terminase small subunit